jgi:hypothetical protein
MTVIQTEGGTSEQRGKHQDRTSRRGVWYKYSVASASHCLMDR